MNIELSIVVNNHGVGLGEIHAATQKVVKMDKTCKLMLNHAFMIVHVAIYTSHSSPGKSNVRKKKLQCKY